MADSLESVNAMNSKSKRLEVRFLDPVVRNPTDKMSIFGGRIASKSGHYACAESIVFGDANQRKKETDALRKKWPDGSAWGLSSVTVKKRQEKYHGCPHGYILNIGAPSLKVAKLTGAAAAGIPSAVEPPQTVSDVLDMSTSQVIDFHASVLDVPEPTFHKGKKLVAVTFADASKTTMPMNFWEDTIDLLPQGATGKVLYVFDA